MNCLTNMRSPFLVSDERSPKMKGRSPFVFSDERSAHHASSAIDVCNQKHQR
ncbi:MULTISPECIES: hypothetical protein [unclassified Microcoleus]|uniref:hypothetical protein n=1 Tax=unclassified Microcoleus TaxID=2642155 RepID=UPI002FD1DE0A